MNQDSQKVEIIIPVNSADKKSVMGVILMNFTSQNINRLSSELSAVSSTLLILLALIIVIFSVLYSKRITKPLKQIEMSIRHISEGYLEEEVHLEGVSELQDVSFAINQMTQTLHNVEDARQEFVSNVSHELKTPITSIRVLADSLLNQEGAPVELYQEFMGDINAELERLNNIINDLLSLVRMDRNANKVQVSEVNVNEFLEGILKRLRPIASQRNIEIIFESFRPVVAQIDEVKLGMALNNVIENAIKYNYEDGWVRVSLNADHKFFYLKVSDSGVGIPEELQDQIFERFYRVDKARSRETGGNGLGLAITRKAILFHRGSIKVHSVEQQGTTFNIRIPLIYLEQGGQGK